MQKWSTCNTFSSWVSKIMFNLKYMSICVYEFKSIDKHYYIFFHLSIGLVFKNLRMQSKENTYKMKTKGNFPWSPTWWPFAIGLGLSSCILMPCQFQRKYRKKDTANVNIYIRCIFFPIFPLKLTWHLSPNESMFVAN